jgi:hypothetical protein
MFEGFSSCSAVSARLTVILFLIVLLYQWFLLVEEYRTPTPQTFVLSFVLSFWD